LEGNGRTAGSPPADTVTEYHPLLQSLTARRACLELQSTDDWKATVVPQAHRQRTPSLNTFHYFSLLRLSVLASSSRALTIGRQRLSPIAEPSRLVFGQTDVVGRAATATARLIGTAIAET
jgi:hypothetical protein